MLVQRIAAGNAEALGDLYDRYGRVRSGCCTGCFPAPRPRKR